VHRFAERVVAKQTEVEVGGCPSATGTSSVAFRPTATTIITPRAVAICNAVNRYIQMRPGEHILFLLLLLGELILAAALLLLSSSDIRRALLAVRSEYIAAVFIAAARGCWPPSARNFW
jgi:hypothetical protein